MPQRPREDPLLLDDRRAVARPCPRRPGRAGQRRAPAAEDRDRRRERAALPVVSAARRGGNPRARAVVLRARRHARDHRHACRITARSRRRPPRKPARAWRGRPRRSGSRHRRSRARPRRRCKPLLDSRDPASVKGRAHYLLGLNDALRRSVISRWARGRAAWSAERRPGQVVSGHRTWRSRRSGWAAGAYSLSALQRFATCPYQFLLATIYRLEPWDEPEPLVRMDPLTRGSLFHRGAGRVLSRARRGARAAGHPQGAAAGGRNARRRARSRGRRVRRDSSRPRSMRVWRDEIDDLRRDLGIWVQKLARGRRLGAQVLRVQLRSERRGARSAQPARIRS